MTDAQAPRSPEDLCPAGPTMQHGIPFARAAHAPRVLVIGYGNPGRLDDGLGPRLADELESLGSDRLTIDSDYQLSVEDAEAVSRHDVVVFVDAAVSGPEPFYVAEVLPTASVGYTSHAIEPGDVLGLARALFGSRARAFVLGIRGYAFDEFGERLSHNAERNLQHARAYLEATLGSSDVLSALGRAAEESRDAIIT